MRALTLREAPFVARLLAARHVLIAGAGGGFDVFSGLPLYLMLREAGVRASLANLSFSHLAQVSGRRVTEVCVAVTADSEGPTYFPEGYLAQWLRRRGDDATIYSFLRTGVAPLTEAWRALQRELGFDAVVLVDGGTDILMRGDEADLGTPVEDLSSLAAVDQLDVPEKLVACLGFGIDRYHGVCHAHFLENAAALTKRGASLGVFSLQLGMPEADAFREAVDEVCRRMPESPSIVGLSVVTALEGEYGDVHRTPRTSNSTLWINPLMSLYWCFELQGVARQHLFLPELLETSTVGEVVLRIEAFRKGLGERVRPRQAIPV